MEKIKALKEKLMKRYEESDNVEDVKFLQENVELLTNIEEEHTSFLGRHEKLKHDHIALIKSSPVSNDEAIEKEDVRPSSSDIFNSWKEGISK